MWFRLKISPLLAARITRFYLPALALVVVSLAADPGFAQLTQYTCRPNDAGDGWICESTNPTAPNTASGVNQYNSPNAVLLPGSVPAAPVPVTPQPTPQLENVEETPVDEDAAGEDSGLTASAAREPVTISAPVSRYPLDWMPREAMTAEQRASLEENCCGAFIDPLAGLPISTVRPDEVETLLQTDAGFNQISRNLLSIDGNVVVQQGARTIENDQTTDINRSENTVLMEGNIVFREPSLLILGNSAFIDSESNSSRIESAQYVIHDYGAHGDASSVVYSSDTGMLSIENGMFSRCEPGNETWTLSAESILLDQENNRGYARKASIRLGNVPIFYYPFTLPFPLGDARVSGFLPPSAGSTRTGGFDFELPYYFNLAPHFDATIAPRLLSDRGVMLGTELRYLASWSMNTLNTSFLSGDKLFDPATRDIVGAESPPTEDRWFLGFEHLGALGRNWSTFVDYNAVSDEDYFYDFGGSGLNVTSRTHLNRQGRLNFNSRFLRADLNVQRIQVIDPFLAVSNIYTPYDRLPQLNFETDSSLPGGFRVALRGQISSFDRSLDENFLSATQIENGALVTGERINLEPGLGWSLEAPGYFLRANASYKQTSYSLENQALNTLADPDFGAAVYSLDSGLVFERNNRNGTTTLEPRLFYLFSDYVDQSDIPLFDTSELNFSFNQLFREDRFSGGDRITDADQVTFALTSRFLDDSGRERGRVSLGQIHYFEDRRVSLSNPLHNWMPRYSPLDEQSALAAELALSLGSNWQLNSDVQWNQESEEISEGSFQLRYQRDSNHLFNIAYRYRSLFNSPFFVLPAGIDPRIKQTDVSGIWPITSNWKLLGRWNYDHSNSRNLESFAGVEWSNCCATIRVIGREWVDENEAFVPNIEPNRGVFLQITLNGLGNLTGGGLSNLLQDGIWGFRDTENP